MTVFTSSQTLKRIYTTQKLDPISTITLVLWCFYNNEG